MQILIIDGNAARAAQIEAGLREKGRNVVHRIGGSALSPRLAAIDPDVILIGLDSSDPDQLERMLELSRPAERPVAMLADRYDQAIVEAAIGAGVSAYTVDGSMQERLSSTVEVAIVRHRATRRLQRELLEAKSALEERKLVERAKGILMQQHGLAEEEAYARLRRSAMNQNRKIGEVARSLIMASELLRKPEGD